MQASELFLTALALALLFEGLLPFIAPQQWRRLFLQLMQMQDGQIRFFGLICILSGLLILWFTGG